ncbi:MAG: efflux RND transporter periplasmic adaptor subunit [Planctomycetes bacterium]|nr:efflux RND transporter periplasmic adaptor subunit [Planctomycetota bacterium]
MNAVLRPFRLLALAACATATAQQPVPVPVTVRTAMPQPLAVNDTAVAPGRTEAVESARIFTRATGIVRERRCDIGDRVEAGAVLALIDAPELDQAVRAAEAQVEQARVRAVNTRAEADRAASLVDTQAMSREEADRRTADAAAAAAALLVAEAEAARLRELQGFATVKAPFRGVVAARNFDRGDRVRGDAAGTDGWLYELVRLDELRFVLPAAPELALRLADAPLPTVRFREFPGRTFPATAVRTSRVFDPATGTMRVELRLANADLLLPAGLSGEAVFTLPALPGGFLVPNNALLLRAGQPTLVVVRDGKVALLPVATGRTRGQQVEVAHAELTATTVVVVNPNAMLRPGDVVQVAPPSTPGPGPR